MPGLRNYGDSALNPVPLLPDPLLDSSNVTFTQAGTGAVKRTAQAKLRDIVSVKDFGAIGDGSTDDTAAIQAALDSLPNSSGGTTGSGGYTILFPPGVYKVTSAIRIGNPGAGKRLILTGPGLIGATGATLKNTTNSNVDIIDASSIVIDTFSMYGLVLWGNGKGTGTGNGVKLGDTSSATKTLFDSQISRCWFTDIPGACIDGQNISDFQIFDNGIENSSVGVRLLNSTVSGGNDSGNRVYSNTIYGCGIGVHQITGGSFGGNDNRITDNMFWFCGTNPGGVGDDTHAAIILNMTGSPAIRDSLIESNTFRACVNDVLLLGNNGSYPGNTGVNAISVIGNHSDRGYRRFLQIDGANNIRVVGNTVDSCGQEANNTYDAIEVIGTSDSCFFDGNSSSTSSGIFNRYGLNLGASTTNTTIGTNDFNGTTAPYNITTGATFSSRGIINGTWTPVLEGSTTAGANTYSVQTGTWSRIGNKIFIEGQITLTAFDAATVGNMRIKNVPFASGQNINATLGAYGGVTMPASTVLTLRATPTTTLLSLLSSNFAGGGLASLDMAAIGAAFTINFSAVYMAS